ncbi:hypothetical protein, partial [Gordonibacter sp.]|uniref:hypothetical protein n=1 Tax=Gordonibacter sp. TaxID=1968902 RepID=UPI002FCBFDD4
TDQSERRKQRFFTRHHTAHTAHTAHTVFFTTAFFARRTKFDKLKGGAASVKLMGTTGNNT